MGIKLLYCLDSTKQILNRDVPVYYINVIIMLEYYSIYKNIYNDI